MISIKKEHNLILYNTLLSLSRNIFFYRDLNLKDCFETRIYLMFFHFSLILIIYKQKKQKFSQKSYDSLFHNIENNLRELGFGDVAVNKKMKDLNKILYDILLKINKDNQGRFELNKRLINKYFVEFNGRNNQKFADFEQYFNNFYNFCFDISLDNMIRDAINFRN